MKKIGVLLIVGLLLCSTLVAAGFWEKITGKFSISQLFAKSLKETAEKPPEVELPEPVCGNNLCEDGEDIQNCPQDCTDQCGNNICDSSSELSSCPNDCWGCGDGFCEAAGPNPETQQNCPQDCTPLSVSCGDNYCSQLEDFNVCPEDCLGSCGDNLCNNRYNNAQLRENLQNCPGDCTPCQTYVRGTQAGVTGDDECAAMGKICASVYHDILKIYKESDDDSCTGKTQLKVQEQYYLGCTGNFQQTTGFIDCIDQPYSTYAEPFYGDVQYNWGSFYVLCCNP